MKKLMILGVLVLTLSACSTTKETTPTEPAAGASATTTGTTGSSTVTEPKAGSATAQVAAGMVTNCMLDKDKRVIEVRKTDSGGCELFYTKFGEEKSVASSGFGTQYCEEVKERIESNLSKAGFSCQ